MIPIQGWPRTVPCFDSFTAGTQTHLLMTSMTLSRDHSSQRGAANVKTIIYGPKQNPLLANVSIKIYVIICVSLWVGLWWLLTAGCLLAWSVRLVEDYIVRLESSGRPSHSLTASVCFKFCSPVCSYSQSSADIVADRPLGSIPRAPPPVVYSASLVQPAKMWGATEREARVIPTRHSFTHSQYWGVLAPWRTVGSVFAVLC